MFDSHDKVELHQIFDEVLEKKKVSLYLLREDLIHPVVSGNKWRKLKYNVAAAIAQKENTILTFGGAYSNHIVATAYAAKQANLKSIGVIRGEQTLPLNPTLKQAIACGMKLHYVDRVGYKNKANPEFIRSLKDRFGSFYVIPEGGSNGLAVKGCAEIIPGIDISFDVVCCACGTGGTIAGIIASANQKQIIGFPALKGGDFLTSDIKALLQAYSNIEGKPLENTEWELNNEYHFGGYAKVRPELVDFVRSFKANHNVELDLIYTGKMLFGLFDMITSSNKFNGQTVIAVHTGGVQGNRGFEERLGITI